MAGIRDSAAGGLRGVVDLLEQVEELPPGANGTLVLGSRTRPGGAIFVEDRRVCWAAASGMATRLTDILLEKSRHLAREDLAKIVKCCRQSDAPIARALAERGMVDDEIDQALIRHSSESLLALSRGGASMRWVPRARGFSSHWRLSTVSMLTHAAALAAEREQPDLTWLSELGASVAVYGRSGGLGLAPIATADIDDLGVRAIAELGPWVASELDLSRAIDPRAHNAVLTTDLGVSVTAWLDGGLLYAAVCRGPRTLPRVLNRYLQRVRQRHATAG